jgi:ribose transport system substrate-binding protein
MRVFGATYMDMVNPFFGVVDDGIREVVEAHGDKLISYDPNSDQMRQLDEIREFISMRVDAIFVNPVDWRGVRPALLEARRAGIPVLNVDTPVYDLDLVDCLVVSDNRQAGVLLAQKLMKMRSGARIAVLDHYTAKSAIDRLDGFMRTLGVSENYKVVARFSSDGMMGKALIGMQSILRTDPRVDVVFATNDPTATGAIAALDAAGAAKGVLVFGVDGAPYCKKLISEGRMAATAAQSPVEIGRTAADLAYRILAGEKVRREVLVPVSLIDASNVERYGIDGWQ